MTLIEVLVAGTLGLVLLGLLFGLLVPSLRVSDRSRVGGELRQSASVIMHKLQNLAARSSPEGFSWKSSSATVVGFNLVDRLQNDGELIWRRDYEMVWWDDNAQTLLHGVYAPTDTLLQNPARPKRLDPTTLAGVVSGLTDPEVWARGVTRFTMEHGGGPEDLRQPVVFTLELEQESSDGMVSYKSRASILLVNQR